jgi:hypothetical protein
LLSKQNGCRKSTCKRQIIKEKIEEIKSFSKSKTSNNIWCYLISKRQKHLLDAQNNLLVANLKPENNRIGRHGHGFDCGFV